MRQERPDAKWYLNPIAISIAILIVGPFALPLVWMTPAFRLWHRIAITIGLVALSLWLVKASSDLYTVLLKDMQELQKTLSR